MLIKLSIKWLSRQKLSSQNLRNDFSEHQDFKFFWGTSPLNSPRGSALQPSHDSSVIKKNICILHTPKGWKVCCGMIRRRIIELYVWFSAGWGTKEAENVFFKTRLGVWVWLCRGSSSHIAFQSSVVFLAFHHCLTFPTHPPSMYF